MLQNPPRMITPPYLLLDLQKNDKWQVSQSSLFFWPPSLPQTTIARDSDMESGGWEVEHRVEESGHHIFFF